MSNDDSLSLRMRTYEECGSGACLPGSFHLVVRVTGEKLYELVRASGAVFRSCNADLDDAMNKTAIELCNKISGCQFAYVHLDEISILVQKNTTPGSYSWTGGDLQRIVGLCSSVATANFMINSCNFRKQVENALKDPAHLYMSSDNKTYFSTRAFVVPEKEIPNYFIWRMQIANYNSLKLLTETIQGKRGIVGKTFEEMCETCLAHGYDWLSMPTAFKRGRCIMKRHNCLYKSSEHEPKEKAFHVLSATDMWKVDNDIPDFTKDKTYLVNAIANSTI